MRNEYLNLISLEGVKLKRKTEHVPGCRKNDFFRRALARIKSNLPGSALRYPSLRNLVGVKFRKKGKADRQSLGLMRFAIRKTADREQSNLPGSALRYPLISSALWTAVFVFATIPATGRDLAESMTTAQNLLNRIGIAAISIGITSGGILFTIGMAQVGRMVLISGIIGALCVLGAPAIISLLARIFGVSV